MTDVKLAVTIAHAPFIPERRTLVLQIERALRRDRAFGDLAYFGITREVLGPPAKGEKRSCWPNVKRAWAAGVSAPGATHVIQLSDDAIPCSDFLTAARNAIAVKPEECINFFRMAGIQAALDRDSAWITGNYTWGGMMAMPVWMVRELFTWEEHHVDPAYPHDDGRLALYLKHTGRTVWTTVPSLLEHGLPGQSTLGNANSRRVAAWWWGAHPGAASIDWTRGADHPVSGGSNLSLTTQAAYRP